MKINDFPLLDLLPAGYTEQELITNGYMDPQEHSEHTASIMTDSSTDKEILNDMTEKSESEDEIAWKDLPRPTSSNAPSEMERVPQSYSPPPSVQPELTDDPSILEISPNSSSSVANSQPVICSLSLITLTRPNDAPGHTSLTAVSANPTFQHCSATTSRLSQISNEHHTTHQTIAVTSPSTELGRKVGTSFNLKSRHIQSHQFRERLRMWKMVERSTTASPTATSAVQPKNFTVEEMNLTESARRLINSKKEERERVERMMREQETAKWIQDTIERKRRGRL